MAQLNTFKSKQFSFVPGTTTTIYTAPAGYTAIILNAQCANVNGDDALVTLKLLKGPIASRTETHLVKLLPIPGNDSANLATGKLVLEPGDELTGVSSSNSNLELTLSLLETLNA